AAALYTYPELAPLIVFCAILIAAPRFWQRGTGWRVWLRGSATGLAVAAALLAPAAPRLAAFAPAQVYFIDLSTIRRGEGMFGGLVRPGSQPAAFWALGAEHQLPPGHGLSQPFALLLSALAAAGLVRLVWRRQYGLSLAAVLLVGGALWM